MNLRRSYRLNTSVGVCYYSNGEIQTIIFLFLRSTYRGKKLFPKWLSDKYNNSETLSRSGIVPNINNDDTLFVTKDQYYNLQEISLDREPVQGLPLEGQCARTSRYGRHLWRKSNTYHLVCEIYLLGKKIFLWLLCTKMVSKLSIINHPHRAFHKYNLQCVRCSVKVLSSRMLGKYSRLEASYRIYGIVLTGRTCCARSNLKIGLPIIFCRS